MASYANPLHRDRRSDYLDYLDSSFDPYVYESDHKAIFEMDSLSERGGGTSDKVNIFIVFVFILEVLVLVFVSVLEYFLRATDVFPVREIPFSCTDANIMYTGGSASYDEFAYNADVSYNVIVPLCFCLPPFLVFICEIALWAFSDEPQKTIRALCRDCRMSQVFRRMIRYIGTFLFGILITMIFVDVIKLFVGRLRPNFLEICKPDMSKCTDGYTNNVSICSERNTDVIRDARLSFPSLMSAMTAFSSCFMAIYLHHIIRAPSVRILRPFLGLGFVLLAVICGLARYGLNYNYWTDSLVGFVIGAVFAVYICIFVLNEFRERLSSQRLYQRLRSFMSDQRALELRDFYKERGQFIPWSWGPWHWNVQDRVERNGYMTYPPPISTAVADTYSMTIPRPHVSHSSAHVNESTTDVEYSRDDVDIAAYRAAAAAAAKNRGPPQNTFQRDLNRALYQYNKQNVTSAPYGNM
ncbi:hypothetical protein CAPTEDRAFT_222391 [Capitella teleta]|uniref:Phosphatidic acid phosphatase type 2/haloperoxidase domain-containing protein n=1 Tax=Capitella teleta TaxID=283909 RepID=R7TIN0_CAPTE|nr:hypothetical protein CAPTEDRAFT_222391 [Capitella teleta]|eukprot:ELT90945.1 hypothetical protein CAPTEDRAFT_222391 [Capitella teleta]